MSRIGVVALQLELRAEDNLDRIVPEIEAAKTCSSLGRNCCPETVVHYRPVESPARWRRWGNERIPG